jgi:hypothetical protein
MPIDSPTHTLWVDFNTERDHRLSTRHLADGTPLAADPPRVGERVLLDDGEGAAGTAVVESLGEDYAVLIVDPFVQ